MYTYIPLICIYSGLHLTKHPGNYILIFCNNLKNYILDWKDIDFIYILNIKLL